MLLRESTYNNNIIIWNSCPWHFIYFDSFDLLVNCNTGKI